MSACVTPTMSEPISVTKNAVRSTYHTERFATVYLSRLNRPDFFCWGTTHLREFFLEYITKYTK